jgi:predicted ArsR family transcriptional regulator
MLERVLQALAAGDPLRLDDLARQLDVPQTLLESMLQDLERMGYLASLAGGCHNACGGCHSAGICAIIGQGRVWSLSEKGARVVGRLGPAQTAER